MLSINHFYWYQISDKINKFSGIFLLIKRNSKRSKENVLKKGREKGGRERKRQMTKVEKDMARLQQVTTLTK